ncbi:MAG: phenylalanine--tRNA ligase subunit beta [Nitrospirae bacterium]|uniref:phenylalanine--tRNA ligase subunit beta n=1 Tax=Candidatus Magnetobacterium casense TaxID=1455061 RepID=UPI00058CD75F|nr:phenylalanine--tRNA ligase subunit beta [Candidatus Magnetobacterium casensis]MBF0337996.1 phenylalanine--tRNA ligase subunit beta [Nitrospirota bacterium]
MLLSLQWLSDFIDLPYEPAKIADMLTMSGHEVESVDDVEGAIVLDINITPNRADCLSVVGIARELAAITGQALKGYTHGQVTDEFAPDMAVEILTPELCYRYTGRIISGIRVGESPQWLKKRLQLSGVRSINNVVDITNYVMLERGQPLHAFDLATLSGRVISVRTPSRDVRFHTLDGVERAIAPTTLMICDKKGPIALAGVMGGLHCEVSEATTSVLLESACFNPASVRKTSKTLNLKSESSYRFERGVDIEGVPVALDRAALLIKELCGGGISAMIDAYPEKFKSREISLTIGKINKIIGANIGQDEVEAILRRLLFDVKSENGRLTLTPPSYRGDIEMDADIIEEIARLYGYENIAPKMPNMSIAMNKKNKRLENIDLLKHVLRDAGFTETINYSFTSSDSLDMFTTSRHPQNRVVIKNPLRSDQALLRTAIVPSLVQNFLYSINHGLTDVHIYEIGTVFFNNADKLPTEKLKIGALAYYGNVKRLWKEDVDTFFRMKGILESILSSLLITQYELTPSEESFLMPDLSLDIRLKHSDKPCGYVGMLATEVIKTLDIKTSTPRVAVMEADLNELFNATSKTIMYTPLFKYPFIERDISLVVDSDITAESIINLVKAYPDNLMESVEVFDYYRGDKLPQDKKSLAFHITYRATDRTLTDTEIDTLHRNLVNYLITSTHGTLR